MSSGIISFSEKVRDIYLFTLQREKKYINYFYINSTLYNQLGWFGLIQSHFMVKLNKILEME